MAGDRYQTFRSFSDVHVFVLCYDGSFYERVPDDIRKQGPWQGEPPRCRRGLEARVAPGAREGLAIEAATRRSIQGGQFQPLWITFACSHSQHDLKGHCWALTPTVDAI